jgi:hypothetical protein
MTKSLITALALLASTAFAAKYESGTICHSNVECNDNCINGQWTVAEKDGGYVFVCDPGVTNPVQWYAQACVYERERFPAESSTKKACDEVGGEICGSACMASGKRSEDGDLRGKWYNACPNLEDGKFIEPVIEVLGGEQEAKKYCS